MDNKFKLKELTVRKDYAKKDTIKGKSGSYRSSENQAGVIMTFEGEGIDVDKAKKMVRQHAADLLNDEGDDPDWIKNDNYLKNRK